MTDLDDMLLLIEAEKKPSVLPSISADVQQMFRAEVGETDGTGAKIKLCRAELADPQRKNTFRKISAMDVLVELLGTDALEDLVPYLGHDYWRLREHARKLASELVTIGGESQLAALFPATGDPAAAAGILEVFAESEADSGLKLAEEALGHAEPVVRKAAVTTLFTLGGEEKLPDVLSHMKAADSIEDLLGCEEALLSMRDDPAHVDRVRDALIGMLEGGSPDLDRSIYYVLGQLADPASIAHLEKVAKGDDLTVLDDVVFALSYSPSRDVDRVMLELAAMDKRTAAVVGAQSVRRLVLGPEGYGDLTGDERMDFAEAMLKLVLDKKVIAYLGKVHEARAMRALMYCLEKGVSGAADSLITCAEGLGKLSDKDSRIAAEALQDVIEYIEVTHLRGGPQAHMRKEDKYAEWKALQARAGKVLLKVHQPDKAPIPTFDPLDLDP